MSYCEEDFADMLFAWPAVEGRLLHLYELDPTHVAVRPASAGTANARRAMPGSRSAPLLCALTEAAAAPALLELDPTHLHAG